MAFIFLLSSTELHEVMRLPQLVIHYIHHHRLDPSLDLARFIHLHYRYNHPADNDERDDQQLPFKSGADILKTDLTNTILPVPLTTHIFIPEIRLYCYCPEGVPRHRTNAVFRPPRCIHHTKVV